MTETIWLDIEMILKYCEHEFSDPGVCNYQVSIIDVKALKGLISIDMWLWT